MEKLPIDPEDNRIPGLEQAFGETLRRHRRALKLTQEVLAIETGLDRTFISLMERGMRRPSLATVFLLANRFSLRPSQLIMEFEEKIIS